MLRGREAGVHVGAIGSGGSGNGNVWWVRAIYWDAGVGVAGRNEGRVVRRSGRRRVCMLELRVVKVGWGMECAVNVYAFASAKVLEVCNVETGETAFEESVAEGDLALEKLCVTA